MCRESTSSCHSCTEDQVLNISLLEAILIYVALNSDCEIGLVYAALAEETRRTDLGLCVRDWHDFEFDLRANRDRAFR